MTRRSASLCSAESEGGYEIGYGKPPRHTQFKPGQSGNRRGRPKGQRNFKTAIKEALREKIPIREGERTRKVSRLDAIVRVTVNNALKGDAKALAALIQLIRPTGLMDEELETPSRETVSGDDDAMLADFLARHGIAGPQDSRGEVSQAETEPPDPENGAKTSKDRKPEDET